MPDEFTLVARTRVHCRNNHQNLKPHLPMLDKTKIVFTPTPLPPSLLEGPDQFFSGDLLGGGQIVPTKKFRKEQHGSKARVFLGPTDAITVEVTLENDHELVAHSYEVNLIKLIYGHNGASLTEDEFHLALSQLVDYLTALFESKDTALSLVPGLSPNNRSWWDKLEISTHRLDPELHLFSALLNASHPCSHKRLVSCQESIRFGTKRSKTAISVYRKQIEMAAKHGADKVDCDQEILRLEVILKKDHLNREFSELNSPSTQFEMIEGEPRLIGFSWSDLEGIHRQVMRRFKGSFDDAPASKEKTDAIGRFIALNHHQFQDESSSTIHDSLELFQTVSKANSTRMGLIRAACLQQRERCALGTEKFSEQFSESAYSLHPKVTVPKKERITSQVREFGSPLPEVITRYSNTSNN